RGVAVRLASGAALPAGGAMAIAWGPGGRLYVGTPGGVSVVKDGRVQTTLAAGSATALVAGEAGIYAATSSGIVLVKADGTVTRLGGPEAVSGGALAVEPGPSGETERVYAGAASGLWVLERDWHRLGAPLLVPAPVTAVAVDDAAVWIGTDAGLVRLSRSV